MKTPRVLFVTVLGALWVLGCISLSAQAVSERGFVEGSGFGFPEKVPNDRANLIGDALFREEVFLKPAPWIQFAGGVDLRANTHDQVSDRVRLDWTDRGILRPAVSIRRFSTTITAGPLTIDAGKQFVRWGKTDIITPTDRFAPRDYLNVIDSEFLPITAVRVAAHAKSETIEGVWEPWFTPSRLPLLTQRWAVEPAAAGGLPLTDAGAVFPDGSQFGVRWSHVGPRVEFSASYFDGNNTAPLLQSTLNAPNGVPSSIDVERLYPHIRAYGGDVAIPTPLITIKGEAEYFTAKSTDSDEYVLYVVQLERQTGEWVIIGGYAGEAVTRVGTIPMFSPDRGLSNGVIAQATYTIDTNRTLTFEGAVHRAGEGLYGKAEYSQAFGQHWRATLDIVGLAGHANDFIGQYDQNSHGIASIRYSF